MEPTNKELSLLVAALMYHLARIEVELYTSDFEEACPVEHKTVTRIISEARKDHQETYLISTVPSHIAEQRDLINALSWALDQVDDDLDPDHQEALAQAQNILHRYT